MGNCLVTKLKESVNNNNLLKMGDFLVDARNVPSVLIEAESSFRYRFANQNGSKIKPIHGNVYMATLSSPKPVEPLAMGEWASLIDDYIDLYVDSPDTQFIIENYSNIITMGRMGYITPLKFNGLDNISSPSYITLNDGNLSSVSSEALEERVLQLTLFEKLNVDIDLGIVINNMPYCTELNCLYANISENTSWWGERVSSVMAALSLPYSTTGSLEAFVSSQRGKGITEKNFIFYKDYHTKISFNGSIVENVISMEFSWTANTITYNGVTINA